MSTKVEATNIHFRGTAIPWWDHSGQYYTRGRGNMAPYTAVTLSLNPDLAVLKQALLLFDRVCVVNLEEERLSLQQFPDFYRELEWLEDQGLVITEDVVEPDKLIIFNEAEKSHITKALKYMSEITSAYRTIHGFNLLFDAKESMSKLMAIEKEFAELCEGTVGECLERIEFYKRGGNFKAFLKVWGGIQLQFATALFRGMGDAVPVYLNENTREAAAAFNTLPGRILNAKEPQSWPVKADVIRIVLSSLPAPDDTIPWDEILSFRRETETQRKWYALKVWVNDVARAAIPPAEIEDKLQHLLAEYRRYMDLSYFKHHPSQLEVVAVTIAEAIESTFKFKFKSLAELPFRLIREQVALLQAEQSAPGREVAYVLAARDRLAHARGSNYRGPRRLKENG